MIDLVRRGQSSVYGQVNAVLKGNTWTNRAGVGDTSPQTITSLDSAKTYLLIKTDGGTVNVDGVDTAVPAKITGKTSTVLTWASGKIALYELSAEEAALDVAVLGQKYHYVNGTKSTNSVRVKSVGKNLFDGKVESGSLDPTTGLPVPNINTARANKFTRFDVTKTYKWSGATLEPGYTHYNRFYDKNYNLLGSTSAVGSLPLVSPDTTPIGAIYVKPVYVSSNNAWVNDKLQLELGTVATPYEPYKESIVNVNLPEPLRSVPSANDEVNVTSGVKTQKNKPYVLQANDIKSINTTWSEDVDIVQISKPRDYIGYNSTAVLGSCTIEGVSQSDIIVGWGSTLFGVKVLKGTMTIEQAKEHFAGLTLTYQLAEPVVTQLDPQPLTIFPNGTQYIEFGTKEVAEYADGINISNAEIPIKAMKTVDKLHIEDGHWKRTAIDLANVAVSPDGLSFTIADAVNGETYEYSYDYDSALSTLPDLEVGEPSLVTRNNRTIVL